MNEREDMGRRLYEACLSGSVPALDALIEKDQLILDRVSSLKCFSDDTPLHVAGLRGHLDFMKALLALKPKLTIELDSLRCSPLHLASAEGHVEIVRELLWVNTNVCIARRIPLHLAVMKGRVEVILELLRAEPELIHEKLGRGETVLHLCVKYNRLEAFKTLVQYLHSNHMEFLLNAGDDNGNTILHLAAALKQKDVSFCVYEELVTLTTMTTKKDQTLKFVHL
ncbi:ankyrin repeat-containing protein BDA1-like [Rhododendron vialii]|uniref:ankyrin repeat-containing protein BDA1-like n=1 Tax=Rhododendron vialii TaxID=182163 RepID=UPI00265FF009|nr:ankyrin repeat-containing protein BDA1-like [Rhododendron vialii]